MTSSPTVRGCTQCASASRCRRLACERGGFGVGDATLAAERPGDASLAQRLARTFAERAGSIAAFRDAQRSFLESTRGDGRTWRRHAVQVGPPRTAVFDSNGLPRRRGHASLRDHRRDAHAARSVLSLRRADQTAITTILRFVCAAPRCPRRGAPASWPTEDTRRSEMRDEPHEAPRPRPRAKRSG